MTAPGLSGSDSSNIFPDSILDRSGMSLMMPSRCFAAASIFSRRST